MDPIKNPYTFGNPVCEPGRFFGRHQEIRQIVNRLTSFAHESTSIIGERRMGKTSLLLYLSNPEVAPTLGMDAEHYCLVYIDFQGLADISPLRFWQRVLRKLSRAINDPIIQKEVELLYQRTSFDLFDLEDLFEIIRQRGKNVVLLMDEFEFVTQNPNLGSDFFGGLRSLAIHYNLSLVTATGQDLVDLCHSDEIKSSPFFNIFATVVLKPFTEQEVKQFLNAYLPDSSGCFSDQEINLAYRLGGGYPFFIQMAGHYLFEAHFHHSLSNATGSSQPGQAVDSTQTTIAEEVLRGFETQTTSHFDYLWNRSSDGEKISLLAVLGMSRQLKNKPQSVITVENLNRIYSRAHIELPGLIRRGLVEERREGLQIFSISYEKWIANEILASPGQEESQQSLEEWLSQNKMGSKLQNRQSLIQYKKKYWAYLTEIMGGIAVNILSSLIYENSFSILSHLK